MTATDATQQQPESVSIAAGPPPFRTWTALLPLIFTALKLNDEGAKAEMQLCKLIQTMAGEADAGRAILQQVRITSPTQAAAPDAPAPEPKPVPESRSPRNDGRAAYSNGARLASNPYSDPSSRAAWAAGWAEASAAVPAPEPMAAHPASVLATGRKKPGPAKGTPKPRSNARR